MAEDDSSNPNPVTAYLDEGPEAAARNGSRGPRRRSFAEVRGCGDSAAERAKFELQTGVALDIGGGVCADLADCGELAGVNLIGFRQTKRIGGRKQRLILIQEQAVRHELADRAQLRFSRTTRGLQASREFRQATGRCPPGS
jgi:hypothetical protein